MLTDISRLLSLALKFETVLRSRSMANLPAVNFVVTTNKTLTDPEIAHFMGAFDKHSILDRYEYLVSKAGFDFKLSFKVDAKQEHEIVWSTDIDKHVNAIVEAPSFDEEKEVVVPETLVVPEVAANGPIVHLDEPQEEVAKEAAEPTKAEIAQEKKDEKAEEAQVKEDEKAEEAEQKLQEKESAKIAADFAKVEAVDLKEAQKLEEANKENVDRETAQRERDEREAQRILEATEKKNVKDAEEAQKADKKKAEDAKKAEEKEAKKKNK